MGKTFAFKLLDLFILLLLQLTAITLLKDSEIQKTLTTGFICITLLVKDYLFQKCCCHEPLPQWSDLWIRLREITIYQWRKVGTEISIELVSNI